MFDVLRTESIRSDAPRTDSRRSDVLHADSGLLGRLVDFTVLGATFYVSCMLLSVELGSSFFFQTLAYSMILLVFVRLSKRTVTSYNKSIGETIRQILGNATGILVGTCVVLLLGNILSARSDILVAVILSGIMAFFVLGTLCPLVHRASSGHKSPPAPFKHKN
jgi:hypothetical protein